MTTMMRLRTIKIRGVVVSPRALLNSWIIFENCSLWLEAQDEVLGSDEWRSAPSIASASLSFELDDGLLVNDAGLGPAVIEKELLIVDLEGLATLYVAHETTVEVWVEVGLLNVVEGLLFVSDCPLVWLLLLPDRCNAKNLHRLRCRRIYLDISWSEVHPPEEGTRILHIELVILKFQHLVLVHINALLRVLLEIGLNSSFENGGARVI